MLKTNAHRLKFENRLFPKKVIFLRFFLVFFKILRKDKIFFLTTSGSLFQKVFVLTE